MPEAFAGKVVEPYLHHQLWTQRLPSRRVVDAPPTKSSGRRAAAVRARLPLRGANLNAGNTVKSEANEVHNSDLKVA